MQISYFEEFPNKSSLSKLKLIYPTNIFIAAKSLKEFNNIQLPKCFTKIYWPVLEKNEGYWISPFSKSKALRRIFKELHNTGTPVMLDLELPTTRNPFLYFTQLPFVLYNKHKIKNFISKKNNIYTVEYFPSSKFSEKILSLLGLSYNKNNKVIKMIYSSMHDFGEHYMRDEIINSKKRFGDRLCLGFGTIGKGILGNEPEISTKLLKRDLSIAKELGVKEIIIFRLGGLNKKYLKIINQ